MLTVITGPMFSGKTSELIRRIRCAEIAQQQTLVFKPSTDTRSGLELLSHNGIRLAARVVDARRPSPLPKGVQVLGIDEAQFLSERWIDSIEEIADRGVEVICACLNQDYLGRPFGLSHQLLARADHVVHLKAVCTECGRKDGATRSFRVAGGQEQVEIGGADKYCALCRPCWVKRRAKARREEAVAAVA